MAQTPANLANDNAENTLGTELESVIRDYFKRVTMDLGALDATLKGVVVDFKFDRRDDFLKVKVPAGTTPEQRVRIQGLFDQAAATVKIGGAARLVSEEEQSPRVKLVDPQFTQETADFAKTEVRF